MIAHCDTCGELARVFTNGSTEHRPRQRCARCLYESVRVSRELIDAYRAPLIDASVDLSTQSNLRHNVVLQGQ